MRKIVKFSSKQRQFEQQQTAELQEQLLLYPSDQLPRREKRTILNKLSQNLDKNDCWAFTMFSKKQVIKLGKSIKKLPPSMRPHQTYEIFIHILLNIHQDTGEVALTREEIAEELEISPENISRIMKTLEAMGVIRKEYEKVAGMRGRGIVVYYVNPDVAWNGSLESRKQESERTKGQFQYKLKLIEGGMAAV